jgi:hypothetical protein
MLAEREILITLLKLTQEHTTEIDSISQEASIPVQIVRNILKKYLDFLEFKTPSGSITVDPEQRLRIAIKTIELGADVERVCKHLTWLEFENISILAFEANDYMTKKHFRFAWADRRWEIDILALKEPLIICTDCKHWQHGWSGSGSRKAAGLQTERTQALVDALKTLNDRIVINKWKHAYFVPMILSLVPANQKFYKDVPIVPVLQLGDFLPQIPAYLGKIAHFRKPI